MMRMRVRENIQAGTFIFFIFQLNGTYSFYSEPDDSAWPPSSNHKPDHYIHSLSDIYRPTYHAEPESKGSISHLKYSLPNKYYDVCSHKGCRNGAKGKVSSIYQKPWPRQLLNNRVDFHQENNEEDPEYTAKMDKLLDLFRKRMTSYIRPEEDGMMNHVSKRSTSQDEKSSINDRTRFEQFRNKFGLLMKADNRLKELYYRWDLLKRDGTHPEEKHDSKSMAKEDSPTTYNQVRMAKELFFDLLKRDSSNKTQTQNTKDKIQMAKELYFNLLKRNADLNFSNDHLIKFLEHPNPEKLAKLKEYFYQIIAKNNSLKSNSDPEKVQKLLSKNENVELVKDLYFDLLKRNVDPKLTGEHILKLLRAKNSKLNKNLGMVKDLYFKLLKRDDPSVQTTTPDNQVTEKDDANLDDKLRTIKALYFDLLKRSSERKISKSDLLKLIKMKMIKGEIPKLNKNLGMFKDLYFKLLKRDSTEIKRMSTLTKEEIRKLTRELYHNLLKRDSDLDSKTSKTERTSEIPDQTEKSKDENQAMAKELLFSLWKHNKNATQTNPRNVMNPVNQKSEKLNKNLGLVKELYFNLLKRDNNKKDLGKIDRVRIPYSNHPHLEGNNDIVKHLFFNFFE